MNYISILGLLVLLGGAWLLSYHRSDVKLRPNSEILGHHRKSSILCES